MGGYSTGYAWVSLGPLSGSSWCNLGEAGAGMSLSNIRKVGGQWTAEYVTIYELRSDASGYNTRYYSNVVLANVVTAHGSAQCEDQYR